MEHYINNLLFTYFPHIVFAVFWFGIFSRFIFANKGIQAKSTQLLSGKNTVLGSNLFHYGILAVLLGHFTLFIPERIYHLVMTTETKKIIALTFGTIFGITTLVGMSMLILRRFREPRIRENSNFQDYFILLLLIFEAFLGLLSVKITAMENVSNYAALGEWAQKVITFQPDAGNVIASHSLIYKIHIVIGMLIFIILPYTKLMHMFLYPFRYLFRKGFQIVRKDSRYIE